MSYCWILFDADGTLFDYDTAEANALQQSFEQLKHPYDVSYNQIYREINAKLWLAFEQGQVTQDDLRTRRFEELLNTIGSEAPPRTFSNLYLHNLSQQTILIDGAELVLKQLANRCRFVIITNGLTQVQRPRFRDSAIAPLMTDVVISEEVGCAKPDREIFDIAFEKMDHPPKADVLMVGDSLSSDIQGGFNYGLDTCWYNPIRKNNEIEADITFEITSLDELISIA